MTIRGSSMKKRIASILLVALLIVGTGSIAHAYAQASSIAGGGAVGVSEGTCTGYGNSYLYPSNYASTGMVGGIPGNMCDYVAVAIVYYSPAGNWTGTTSYSSAPTFKSKTVSTAYRLQYGLHRADGWH
jgi:hypothetical protein